MRSRRRRLSADRVQVAQRLRVGGREAHLGIRQPMLLAEVPDQGLRPAQAGTGHGREKVMLDLVVQAAQRKVSQPAAADVARGEDLTAQEIGLVRPLQDRHSLVVRGERGAKVQAEQALLDDDSKTNERSTPQQVVTYC